VDEFQLSDGEFRKDEWIQIGEADAAVEGIEGVSERIPVLKNGAETGFKIVNVVGSAGHGVGGWVFAGAQAESKTSGRFESIDNMQVVSPGFGPIFPRVGGGISGDESILPIRRRALLIVGFQGGSVVHAFIPKELAERFEFGSRGDENVPIIMGDFVAEMAEERAERLAKIDSASLAFGVVGLDGVDSDEAIGMASKDWRGAGSIAQKTEAQGFVAFGAITLEGKAKFEEGVDDAAFGGFEFAPALEVFRQIEIGDDIVQAAGGAESF
jgi:hypothetical protein